MQYALLIYSDEATNPKPGTPEGDQLVADYFKYTNAIQGEGLMQGGHALHDTDSATTVRVRDGETLTTDGPFAETKEQLGGLYVVDCPDLDAAIAAAARIPSARFGSIEVRPILEY